MAIETFYCHRMVDDVCMRFSEFHLQKKLAIAQIWAQGISTKVRRTTFVFGYILCSHARAYYTKYPQTRRLDFVTYMLIPRVGFAKNLLAKNCTYLRLNSTICRPRTLLDRGRHSSILRSIRLKCFKFVGACLGSGYGESMSTTMSGVFPASRWNES